MTARQAPRGEPAAADRAMSSHRFERVLRARRCEAARRRKDRRDQQLIPANGPRHEARRKGDRRHRSPDARSAPMEEVLAEIVERGAVRRSARADHDIARHEVVLNLASPELAEAAPDPVPRHRGSAKARDDHAHARMAGGIVSPVDVEMRLAGAATGGNHTAKVSGADQPARARKALGAGQTRACLEPIDTESRFRPFLRRRDNTARPQRSAMRLRKPCLAIRRLFRGRYVGIIAGHSLPKSGPSYRRGTASVKV